MNLTKRFLLIIIIVFSLIPSGLVLAAVDQITLFIPAFSGPGALGRNVATVLNLRIWHTFRRKPWPHNPDNLDFGRGLIIWDSKAQKKQNHSAAEDMAKDLRVLAQLVLWGKAYPYGDGVVVQSNLSIPSYDDYRETKLELWSVSFRGRTVQVDIPRRRLEMASIVLKRNIIEQYTLPSALKIYKNRVDGEPIGTVGDSYIGIQFESGFAKVISGATEGWVRLPRLGERPTEVVDFVAGVIRIFRGDWQGAISSMRRVIENPSTRTPLKIDAYLYWGMALEREEKSGFPIIQKAYHLNPYSLPTIRYMIMSKLSALMRLANLHDSKEKATMVAREMKRIIDDHIYLFPQNDSWLQKVLEIMEEIASN
jgi:hypothetical protein